MVADDLEAQQDGFLDRATPDVVDDIRDAAEKARVGNHIDVQDAVAETPGYDVAATTAPPRMHVPRCHGVLAAHSRLRAAITPAGCGA